MSSSGKKRSKPPEDEPTALVTAFAVATGGFLGTGLSLASQHLPHGMQAVAYPFIATFSSGCSLAVRVTATKMIREFSKRLWAKEQQAVIQQAIHEIKLLEKELSELENKSVRNNVAEKRARAHIELRELMKIEAMGANPFERPWLLDLKKLVNGN